MTAIYLSRLLLNLRRRDVQRDLADCHNMHRRLLSAFPDEATIEHARAAFGVLYRIERQGAGAAQAFTVVLVQSRERPDWSRLPMDYMAQAEVKDAGPLYQAMRPGLELRFRLCANPVRRIGERDMTQAEKWRGKRVDLRREDEQRAWLRRKGAEAGFTLLAVRARPDGEDVEHALMAASGVVHGARRGAPRMTFRSVVFEGVLRVVDAERFRQALAGGIGPAKAFGFGLLSVAPATPSSV